MLSQNYYRDLAASMKQRGAAVTSREISEGLEKKDLRPADFNFQRLFEATVPDGAELLRLARQNGGNAPEVRLYESGDALGISDFTTITRNIIFAEIMSAMENEAYVFTPLIPTKPARFRYGEVAPRVGGFSDDVEAINEKESYPELGLTEDWIRTPPPVKRGGIVSVTWELSLFDTTGMVLEQARGIGDAMAYNKEIRAIDCIIDENTTAHRYRYRDNAPIATYGDNSGSHSWDNLQGSNALTDWTDIDAVEQLAQTITDPITGRPVAIDLADLIVTPQNMNKAHYILNATELHVAPGGFAQSGLTSVQVLQNPYRSKYRLLSSRLLALRMTTDSSWYLNNLAKAFAYMEVSPVQVFQAPPNNSREFHNDILAQFKVREMGAYATIEPRYAFKATQ